MKDGFEQKYYILSIKRSRDHVIWWRPDGAGYTHDLACAGVYAQSQINDRTGYYNNGETTHAIPVEWAEREACRSVPMSKMPIMRANNLAEHLMQQAKELHG